MTFAWPDVVSGFTCRGAASALAAMFWCAAFSPSLVRADPYDRLARDLSQFAGGLAYQRVAVLLFTDGSGGESETGLALSERLVTRLVAQGKLQVVERTLLKRVLDEQGLGYQGLIDPRQAKKIGHILGVDAVVTGTFLHLPNGKLEVNARIIDAENARILGVSTERVDSEWQESLFSHSLGTTIVPPPNLGSSLGAAGADFFRDSVSGELPDCADWESRVYSIQNSTLELKARYWAARLRDPGFSTSQLKENPGSEIRSLGLRQELYARVREFYHENNEGSMAAQNQGEIERADRKVEFLVQRCDR